MRFQGKPFKLGHSKAVYIPKEVYTKLAEGKVYTFEVILDEEPIIVHTDQTGVDIHLKPNKKLVFNLKKGVDEWVSLP